MESFANLFPVTGKNSGKTSPLESSFDGKCPISAKLPDSQRTEPKMKQGLTGKIFRLRTWKSPRLAPPSRITLGLPIAPQATHYSMNGVYSVKSKEIDVRPSFDFTHSKAKIRGVKRCWGTDIPNGAR
jgi:hypothetical protein